MAKVETEEFYTLLHPRPVVLVVTMSEEGKVNVAAVSWITPVSEEPPTVALALDKESYTLELIEKTKEFTVNVPSQELLDKVWLAGTRSGRTTDKAKLMGVRFIKSKRVKPPVIEECIGHLECKLVESLPVGECKLVVGEVLEYYADEDKMYKLTYWNLSEARVLLHVGGRVFTVPQRIIVVRK